MPITSTAIDYLNHDITSFALIELTSFHLFHSAPSLIARLTILFQRPRALSEKSDAIMNNSARRNALRSLRYFGSVIIIWFTGSPFPN